jgi:hypothetical protein
MGYRTIVRDMLFAAPSGLSNLNAQMSVWIKKYQDPAWYQVWWWWFGDSSTGLTRATYLAHFNGMLVVDQGDELRASNVTGAMLHTLGSGMVVKIAT